jgi:hypothetical protein
MIARYNRKSMLFGVPGLLLAFVGIFGEIPLLALVGNVTVFTGLVYYAKAKARHWSWSFINFLPNLALPLNLPAPVYGLMQLFALVVLASLRDNAPKEAPARRASQESRKACPRCGRPLLHSGRCVACDTAATL